MAKEKLIRPDPGRVKELLALAQQTEKQLKKILDSEQSYKEAAQKAAQALFDDRLRKTLETMDVDHINRAKQGIRVSALKDAGIDNIWKLSRLSEDEICRVEGLGEQTAKKIKETLEEITAHTEQTLRVRIDTENPGAIDDVLIRVLYNMIHSRPLRQKARSLANAHLASMTREAEQVKEGRNLLLWMFRSRQKKVAIMDACCRLEERLQGPLDISGLSEDWQKLTRASAETYWADYRANAAAYYAELERLGLAWDRGDAAPGGIPAQLASEIQTRPLALEGLRATLRSYQTFGTQYILHQKRTLLGDEMGLGKTMQAIAAMVVLKAEGKSHFMVVCPASVLVNWCREIQKFSDLAVTKIHGNDAAALQNWIENGGVAVTTYESISRFTLPAELTIAMVTTDEAHYVKNPETLRTRSLQKLLKQAEYVLFMSGTPLENRAEEMCFLVSLLQPEIAKKLEKVKYVATAQQFRGELAPVYLRRTREDVLQELPELSEKEQWCTLGDTERKAYKEAVNSENFMAIRQVSWNVADLKDSSKAARLLELCDQAKEQKRKVIVFSFFRTTIARVVSLLGDRCMEPITGAITPQRRQEIVDEFGKAGDGAVLVSQVQAGGTGLNIQSASVIIFCEPQIKPSIENQAISRAYRMGQVRDVLVYRLLADDTVDEQIMEILKEKQNIFDHLADESVVGTESLKESGESWITRMVAEEKKRLENAKV